MSFEIKKGGLVLITGASGCGKTTLLKMLKPCISPVGSVSGEVSVLGEKACPENDGASIGYVSQDPESACVSDTVLGELAFAPENMGLSPEEVQLRIAETASWFGIGKLLDRELSTLSGGELKMVSLCAVMTMRPEILLLDEPVSRLDPVAAENFMSAVIRLNRELGTTVIIAEHRCESFFSICDKILPMENGTVLGAFSPEEAAAALKGRPEASCFLPCAARIAKNSAKAILLPLTVRSGREFLQNNYEKVSVVACENGGFTGEIALECRDLCFAYSRTSPDIISGAELTVRKGEAVTILGANGSGKTTLLGCLSGLHKPYNGRVKVFGKPISSYKNGSLYRGCMALLPQDPSDVFTSFSVGEDYRAAVKALGGEAREADEMLGKLGVSHLEKTHPYDLSGGEMQLCALGRVLLSRPRILLLDEPTKGLDAVSCERLIGILRELKKNGTALLAVTHDLEFAAALSDRCGLFFGGTNTEPVHPSVFFNGTQLYTTPTARICGGIFSGAYLVSQAAEIIASQDGKISDRSRT